MRYVDSHTEGEPTRVIIDGGPDLGDGSLQETEELARLLGLEDRVRIDGAVAHGDVPQVFARGDIFLNTTNCESFGVSVVEAAASGLCIVSTDAGALADMWANGRDALLVPRRDHVAMTDAVRRILTKPGLAARLSRNGRRTAERYDRESILTYWEELLNQVGRCRRR